MASSSTALVTELGNSVKVTVRPTNQGFFPEVTAPDVYTDQLIVHPLSNKTFKTEAGAMRSGIKYATETFAHIIDPEAYWA